MNYSVTLLLATVLFLEMSPITGVKSHRIITDPPYIQVPKSGQFDARCFTEPQEPITKCQFRILYVDKKEQGILLNVLRSDVWKTVTIPNPYHPNTNYTAEFHGGHFNSGACAVRIYDLQGDFVLIGCKLTTKSNESATETIRVFFHDETATKTTPTNPSTILGTHPATAASTTQVTINPTTSPTPSTTPLSREIVETLTTTSSKSDSGDMSSNTLLIIGATALPLVVVNVAICLLVAYFKKLACFKANISQERHAEDRSKSSTPEPIYEEIDESFPMAILPPPALPRRDKPQKLNKKSAPKVNDEEYSGYLMPNPSAALKPTAKLIRTGRNNMKRLAVPSQYAPQKPYHIIPDDPKNRALKLVPATAKVPLMPPSTKKPLVLPGKSQRHRPEEPQYMNQDNTDDSLDANGYLKIIG